MKKVSTNLTFGQVLFILLTVFSSSLMFFYLGAKFGLGVTSISSSRESSGPLLPDDQLASEVKDIINNNKPQYVFHEVLQEKQSLDSTNPKQTAELTYDRSKAYQKESADLAAEKAEEVKTPPEVAKVEPIKPDVKVATKLDVDASKKLEITKLEKPVVKVEKPVVKIPEPVKPPVAVETPLPTPEKVVALESKSPSYRLQLGSFAEKQSADSAVAEWQSRGFSARVVSSQVAGKGTWYRLQLGSYSNLDEVKQAQRNIMKTYQQSPMIVPVQ